MAAKSENAKEVSGSKGRTWKILVVDPRRCIGCEICESVCVFVHDGEFNPLNARINRVRVEPIINNALNCLKCQDPACVTACELGALSQDPETGNIIVDYDICDGCASCVKACPYGAITVHSTKNKAIVCDLCESTEYDEPQCVKYCPKQAIFIEEIEADSPEDRLITYEKILERGFPGEGNLN